MKRERGMAVDVWEMAAECARAVEGSEDATRRAVFGSLQKLWIELGEKEGLLSDQEVRRRRKTSTPCIRTSWEDSRRPSGRSPRPPVSLKRLKPA